MHLTIGVDSWSTQDFTTGRRFPGLTIPEVLYRVLLGSKKVSKVSKVLKHQLQEDVQHLQEDINFRRSMPVGGQNNCESWIKSVHSTLYELKHVRDASSTILNEDEIATAMQKLREEYTKELGAWRAAMASLAGGHD